MEEIPMKRRNFAYPPGCAVQATLERRRYHLHDGTQRFGELRRRMPGITQRMLTKQLRALEDNQLVIRKLYAEVPPRVEYRLSAIGERLRPVIDTLRAVGRGPSRKAILCAWLRCHQDTQSRCLTRLCRSGFSSLAVASALYLGRRFLGFLA
jgi:DNA-binding HxlR family transcriptional regulator